MTRFAPRILALLLCGTALGGCATMGKPDLKTSLAAKEKTAAPQVAVGDDLDSHVREAQLLRLAERYDEAIRTLSQLMLVASDDGRVVGEYGKTLAQKGRAQDAAQFLRRAIEISPNDWTLYSALGVAYDQTGDQVNARTAYEHALVLRPGEGSVLNNYALSRMLAKDPQGAQALIARAQASGVTDPKIARNVALINGLVAPETTAATAPAAMAKAAAPKPVVAAQMPAPKAAASKPAAQIAKDGPRDAKDIAQLLANQPLPAPEPATTSAPVSNGAPRPLVPAASAQSGTVVMQAVPYDRYAGPVAQHAPKPKTKDVAAADKPKADMPVKTAEAKKEPVPALRMAADKY